MCVRLCGVGIGGFFLYGKKIKRRRNAALPFLILTY